MASNRTLARPAIVAALALAAGLARPAGVEAQRVRSITGAQDSAKAVPKREFGTIDGIVTDTALTPLTAAQVTVLSTAVRVGTGP
ncbi:MAG: hypothetical protein U9Q74_12970, partial [Gemmatimonadota bacterium]|nr:hypothetical protein [Gemmatimonadota bacterium]